MDLHSRTAGSGPSWSWPRSDTGSGGDTSTHGATATSTSNDYLHAPTPSDFGGVSDVSDASGLTDESRRATPQPEQQQEDPEFERFKRRYKPRTCRICLEVVEPTFEGLDEEMEELATEGANAGGLGGIGDRVAGAVASAIPTFLRPQPRVRYISENPADGRLLSPCRCKGTQKYVHEGCLTAWRHAQPLSGRNYWKCPTCGFEYRFERLRWGQLISNKGTQVLLTLFVFSLAIFLLGFVADPLIDLWLDPAGTIVDQIVDIGDVDLDDSILGNLADIIHAHDGMGGEDACYGWAEHFLKGFFSLGIVGVVKTFLVVSPFTWWNVRMGRFGRRRRNGGQARIEGFGWMFIVIGVFTFLGAVWKGMSYVTGRVLENASEHVIDIQGDDDDDDDDDEGNRTAENTDAGHDSDH